MFPSSMSKHLSTAAKLTTRKQSRAKEEGRRSMSLFLHSDIFLSSITLLFFVCCSLSSSSTTTTRIQPGSSLSPSNTDQSSSSSIWSSPGKNFSIGFSKVGPNSYSFSISYLSREPIWTPGHTTVDRAGVFRFSSTGNLQVINGSGTILWDSKTDNLGINSASLDDSGNLILSKNTVPVWSSFDNPTDSIIPSQNFTKNQTLRSGSYSLRLLDSGNLSLTWNENVMYWNQALSSSASNFTSPSLELQPNGILQISDGNLRSVINVANSNDYGEGTGVFRFLRLDKDGNFRMYSLSSGNNETTSATVTWGLISDQCQVFGYCGNMGICRYNELSSSPTCGCPSQNFKFVDVNDGRKGCKRKVELQNCQESATILELKHTKFLTYFPEEMFTLGITACKSNCLLSESCVASSSLSDGTGLCYMKTPDLVSGYQNPALPSISYVKVCAPAQPNRLNSSSSVSKCWRLRIWVIGLATLATVLGMVALLSCFSWWRCCKNSSQFDRPWAQYALIEYASGAPVRFSYNELHNLTKGFKDELGTGGFGAVYKGMLANRTEVAVKQLEGIEQGEKQFQMEVVTISSTHHLNLVRLVGFCSQGRHRLLVYELMKNGSLDSFLFSAENQRRTLLSWERRFNIALGTARGITYLHEECRVCIVHCDIKPENILLDENFNAKVSDFGLAKLVNTKNHRHQSINVRGTRGYLAPEWLANLPITSKSDVYSYGMVLLEMVTGRRNFEVSKDTNQKKLSEWCYQEFEKGNVEAIVDRKLVQMDMEQVMRAVHVSFWCIQENPSQRPTMKKVVQMLEGVVEISRPPPPKPLDCAAFSSFDVSTPPPPSSSSIQETAGISPYDTSLPSTQTCALLSDTAFHI